MQFQTVSIFIIQRELEPVLKFVRRSRQIYDVDRKGVGPRAMIQFR